MRRAVTVWREPAHVQDWQRFNQVKRLLKKKYGMRFTSLVPTMAAAENLLGGDPLARLTPW